MDLKIAEPALAAFPQENGFSEEIAGLIKHLAHLWAQDAGRPRPTPQVSQHWDSLIAAWADDCSLPLYIRKAADSRGSVMVHRSGRRLIPTDNSPAQWAFARAVLGETPSLSEIRRSVEEDRIPVAMILKTSERVAAHYKCLLKTVASPSSAGWKVAHLAAIGLGNTGQLSGVDESILRQHFRKFMTPSNMFVVPLRYAGLGELPEFCNSVGEADDNI